VAKRVSAKRDVLVMVAALAVITAASAFGTLERWQGLLLMAGLVVYVAWSYRADSRRVTREGALHLADAADAECLPSSEPFWSVVALLVGGLALLGLGAMWVVTAASAAARSFGLSEAAIGLTVVSLGTTLPELSAAIASARHGHSELVIGNVIGSNIFNALGILGLCALVRPLPIERAFVLLDLPLLIIVALALLPVFTGRSGLRRWAGAAMIAMYAAYFAIRFLV
jgi:cation:H+ antiporter